jgi:S-adenosylmethionine:tRNA ribosyltransferase-isomerase
MWYYSAMTTPVAELLKLSDFDFDLSESLIAQEPCALRGNSRLMTLDRRTGVVEHRMFPDIGRLLIPGDLLVLNNTRVIPCRLPAKKPGGGKAEIFLLSEQGPNLWTALVKGVGGIGKRLRVSSDIEAEITAQGRDNVRTVRFHGVSDIRNILSEIGGVPLPPYIKRAPTAIDRERYQTVYASQDGAVAAPTAGLHFTPELLEKLRADNVELAFVTLHVGPGTFQPVRVDNIAEHRMLPEQYIIPENTAVRINRAKEEGRRVIAIGTTSVRTLESAADADGTVVAGGGSSELFIYPGYAFKVIDGIITNFHLPKSTLLMLVSAFAGKERILAAYDAAIKARYRFYSYGDAMAIL